jgi:3-oxoacyl-[acyl-carrier protein] reductase
LTTGNRAAGRLEGKVALITGAARGIGRAIGEAFAREGADLAIVDRAPLDGLTTIAQGMGRPGVMTAAFAVDVADDDAVAAMVAEALRQLGRIDILVNNAGVTQRKPFLELTLRDWDDLMAVNLRGVFLVTRHVVPVMMRGGGGTIINIASQMAQRGAPQLVHYSASKAGVIGFTKALARELAPTISVNAIAPGPVMTDMISERSPQWFERMIAELPLHRIGTPEEIAPTAVFLASSDAALYTGQTLGPNGGHVML